MIKKYTALKNVAKKNIKRRWFYKLNNLNSDGDSSDISFPLWKYYRVDWL